MCKKEDSFRDGYDHFNMSHSWNGGMIKAPAYTSNDLMVLRTFEWDRINFSNPRKRKKIANRLEMTDEELLLMRKQTRDGMYKRLKLNGLNDTNEASSNSGNESSNLKQISEKKEQKQLREYQNRIKQVNT
jgi:hypothetical protein